MAGTFPRDPGSPKLILVSWNLNTLRFVSVIVHPNRSSSDNSVSRDSLGIAEVQEEEEAMKRMQVESSDESSGCPRARAK